MAYIDEHGVEFSDDRKTLVRCPKDFQGEYIIPEGVINILMFAFRYCRGLTSISIPNSVTSIGDETFYGCTSLPSISIPNSVKSIGKEAFNGCSALTSITIPSSVTRVGESAFCGCSRLTSITIPNSISSISTRAFANCSGLTSITIQDGVRSIGDLAFFDCTSLPSISIPNSVTSIGFSAFYNCTSLTAVTIPNSVKSIGDRAFVGCSSLPIIDNIRYADTYLVETKDKTLSTYKIKEGTIWIGYGAFEKCAGLTNIAIPNSVTTIGRRAFAGCSGLASITIPKSITDIREQAFYNCQGLVTVILHSIFIVSKSYRFSSDYDRITEKFGRQVKDYILGDEITSIGDYAFHFCTGITSVTIPNNVTSIGEGAFSSCSNLISIDIPNSISKICDSTFSNSGLKSITIPNSVTSIGDRAFSGCYNLTSITIPDSVINIGKSAFAGSALTSITIPNSVTSIGENAFRYCKNLDVIYINNGERARLFQQNGLKDDNYYVMELDNDGHAIDKYGIMFSHDCKTLISCPNDFIGEYSIPKFTTHIAEKAFKGCYNLYAITIPDSVISIGAFAFAECSHLVSVDMGLNVTDIEVGAFSECRRLKKIDLPHGVKTIGRRAFYLTSLESIIIPNSVIKIGSEAFVSCILKEVFFLCKNGAVDVGESVFETDIYDSVTHVPLSYQEQLSEFNDQFIPCCVKGSLEADILFLKNIINYYFLSPNSKYYLNLKDRFMISLAGSNIKELRDTIVNNYLRVINSRLSEEDVNGNEPISFKRTDVNPTMKGLEIPNEIYQVFREAQAELPEKVWSSSGQRAFEKMQDQKGLRVGKCTPRLGYYKVCDITHIDGETYLSCFYNMRNAEYFVDEFVKIKKSPFYNHYSIGPKEEYIKKGDIIHIFRPVELIESSHKGEPCKAYKLVWEFVKHTFQNRAVNDQDPDYEDEARWIEETLGVDIRGSIF